MFAERISQSDTRAVFRLVGDLCRGDGHPRDWLCRLLPALSALTDAGVAASGIAPLHRLASATPSATRGYYYALDRERSSAPKKLTDGEFSARFAGELAASPRRFRRACRRIYGELPIVGAGQKFLIYLGRSQRCPAFAAREFAIVHLLVEELDYLWERQHRLSPVQLPPRLREVLDLMIAGHRETQIASRLKLSHHTIHDHVKRLYALMNVTSRAGLMRASEAAPRCAPSLRDEAG